MARRNNHRQIPQFDSRILQAQSQAQAQLENQIAAQNLQIQALLVDKQRLVATHVELNHNLSAAQQEYHRLSSTASAIQSESGVREVYEKALALESKVRFIDNQAVELTQVQTDVKNLTVENELLTAKLASINENLVSARSELQKFPSIQTEIENMHQEIKRGRDAIEYEKKIQVSNEENSRIMTENMISMAREIEKLKEELANAEKKASEAAIASNPGFAVNVQPGYGVNMYPPHPYPMPQIQGQYVPEMMGYGQYGPHMHHQ